MGPWGFYLQVGTFIRAPACAGASGGVGQAELEAKTKELQELQRPGRQFAWGSPHRKRGAHVMTRNLGLTRGLHPDVSRRNLRN